MTGRRESFFQKWTPAHNLTFEEAVKKFPEEVGIIVSENRKRSLT
jgi:3-oxoacyl-[acyl-carrier protein] reductase